MCYALSITKWAKFTQNGLDSLCRGTESAFRNNLYDAKMPNCRVYHPSYSCSERFFYIFPNQVQTFAPMYTLLHIGPSLLFRPMKAIERPMEFFGRKLTFAIRSTLVLSFAASICPLIYCITRQLFNDNGLPGFLSAFLGALFSFPFENSERHRQYATSIRFTKNFRSYFS